MNERNDNDWKGRLALKEWRRGRLTWTELNNALQDAGLSQQRAEELDAELGAAERAERGW